MNGTGGGNRFAAIPGRPTSVFVPVLLLALAVVGSLGMQSFYLALERRQLAAAGTSLTAQEQAAAKVRASLDALATATARLAAAGNTNAAAIVEQLRRRGVAINTTPGTKSP